SPETSSASSGSPPWPPSKRRAAIKPNASAPYVSAFGFTPPRTNARASASSQPATAPPGRPRTVSSTSALPARLHVDGNPQGELADHLEQPVVRERMQRPSAHVAIPAFERIAAKDARAADQLHRLRDDLERRVGG